MACAAWESDGKGKRSQHARVIVDGEAAESRHHPARRYREREHVGESGEGEMSSPEECEYGDESAQHTAGGGEAVPDFEQLERAAFAQLLWMIEEQVHQVAADQPAEERPARCLLQRLRVQPAPHRLAHQQAAGQKDAGGGQDAKGLQRKRTEAQRRNHEPGNHCFETAACSRYSIKGGPMPA